MNQFLVEVKTQGEVLEHCIDQYFSKRNHSLEKIKEMYDSGEFKQIVFSGMGSSYYAPFSVSNYLTNNGIPSYVINSYEMYKYNMGLLTPETLLVTVSQSGQSPEVVELLKMAKENKTTVVGVVNQEDSTVAKEVDIPLFMYAGNEKHISNKSYLNTLAVLKILSVSLVEGLSDGLKQKLDDIVTWTNDFIDKIESNTDPVFEFVKDSDNYDFIGNGPSLSTAYQAGLIYREGPFVTASGISCADYSHGWDLSMKPGHTAFIFDPLGEDNSVEKEMINNIINKGGKVVLITPKEVKPNDSLYVINHPVVSEEIAPMYQITPCNTIMGWLIGDEANDN